VGIQGRLTNPGEIVAILPRVLSRANIAPFHENAYQTDGTRKPKKMLPWQPVI